MDTAFKEAAYAQARNDLERLLQGETDRVSKMATINAVLKHALMYYFWVWFYIVHREGHLKVWPYQGTVGYLNISFDRGVCGACATKQETIIVPDVHKFPGHIACDAMSNSEIVVPVFENSTLIAVFDVDSTELASFDTIDKERLEKIMTRRFGSK